MNHVIRALCLLAIVALAAVGCGKDDKKPADKGSEKAAPTKAETPIKAATPPAPSNQGAAAAADDGADDEADDGADDEADDGADDDADDGADDEADDGADEVEEEAEEAEETE